MMFSLKSAVLSSFISTMNIRIYFNLVCLYFDRLFIVSAFDIEETMILGPFLL